jgi:hypothetical protein
MPAVLLVEDVGSQEIAERDRAPAGGRAIVTES